MKDIVIVRGGGDIATGTIYKLVQCGFKVLVLEVEKPSAIRINVAFCQSVYDGEKVIEGCRAVLCHHLEEAYGVMEKNDIAVMVDPDCTLIEQVKPFAVVDAILAKKNLGTYKEMAPITIGLGPGFEAGVDVDAVIETMRGHDLGRVIYHGKAMDNTGIPGLIQGYGKERVIHAPVAGIVSTCKKITDIVKKDEVIAYIDDYPVVASMDGILRGLIHNGYQVHKGFKMADIDPRIDEVKNCFTISDKARCIAGGVIEAILHLRGQL